MVEDDFNNMDMGYEDESPEREIQEGAEEEIDANNEDVLVELVDAEDTKEEHETKERPRKTSKSITKYERARILGTRALLIQHEYPCDG